MLDKYDIQAENEFRYLEMRFNMRFVTEVKNDEIACWLELKDGIATLFVWADDNAVPVVSLNTNGTIARSTNWGKELKAAGFKTQRGGKVKIEETIQLLTDE